MTPLNLAHRRFPHRIRTLGFGLESGEDEICVCPAAGAIEGQTVVGQRFEPQCRYLRLRGLQGNFIGLLGRVRSAGKNGKIVERFQLGAAGGSEGCGLEHVPAGLNPLALLLLPRELFPAQRVVRLVQQRAALAFQGRNLIRQFCHGHRLLRRRHFDERRGGIAVEPLFRDAIEEIVELIILALGERVVLVVMTFRAGRTRAEVNGAERVHAVGHILVHVLVRVGAALRAAHAIPVEGRGNALLDLRIGQ